MSFPPEPKGPRHLDDTVEMKSPVVVKDDSNSLKPEREEIETTDDLFLPLTGVAPYEGHRILTVRAVLTGMVLGSLIAISNIYLGLKTGMGADGTLFSSIFGFAILKMSEKSNLPLVSGVFGPHENNIIQATALGTVGVGFMFITGVPAMYQLGLLSTDVTKDYPRLVCFTLVAGFWGLGFTPALRSMFIIRLARPLGLTFPAGTAAAITIRTLHSVGDGGKRAKENLKTMMTVFSGSVVWSVGTSYVPGILYTWNPFWWIYKWGGKGAISAVSWGWLSWSWSPAYLAIGMFIDTNAAVSLLLGTVLAWGIVGPVTVAVGVTAGIAGYNPKYPDLVTYSAFDPRTFSTIPSPRYWVLFPAVFMMLAVSLTSILLESKRLLDQMAYVGKTIRRLLNKGGPDPSTDRHDAAACTADEMNMNSLDPVGQKYPVRFWEWTSVTVIFTAIGLAALKYTFGIAPEFTLLAMVLGVLWSFVTLQVFGASGNSPITTVAKGSQFITGAILRVQVGSIGTAQAALTNLGTAALSAATAQQATELVQDFRTGYLLGTPPRHQWYAQMLGTLSAVFLSPGVFVLFTKAYPCILDASATTCPFAVPSVSTWRVVTQAMLSPTFPISQSSWIFTIIMCVIGSASVILRWWLLHNERLKDYAKFVPNMSLVGLMMCIPGSSVSVSLAIGHFAAKLWKQLHPASYSIHFYPVAAGGAAGEGIGFVIISILQIARVAGSYYGTKIGCVAEIC